MMSAWPRGLAAEEDPPGVADGTIDAPVGVA
jgi:hypothetical protein